MEVFHNPISAFHRKVDCDNEKNLKVSKAPMGELYPVFSVQGTKDSNLYMFISSGKIADINETEDLMESYPMLSQEIEANEEVVAWWESAEDTYSICAFQLVRYCARTERNNIHTRKG